MAEHRVPDLTVIAALAGFGGLDGAIGIVPQFSRIDKLRQAVDIGGGRRGGLQLELVTGGIPEESRCAIGQMDIFGEALQVAAEAGDGGRRCLVIECDASFYIGENLLSDSILRSVIVITKIVDGRIKLVDKSFDAGA